MPASVLAARADAAMADEDDDEVQYVLFSFCLFIKYTFFFPFFF